MHGGWTEAPHLFGEVYNLEDALVMCNVERVLDLEMRLQEPQGLIHAARDIGE